jgi:hypothetical protein
MSYTLYLGKAMKDINLVLDCIGGCVILTGEIDGQR